ncbi:uncharacterized protein EAF01_000370 [Botrytis porri]|uniref:Uncharacterized protein n=1 Tax=Botrytis porri TaxID=87229 RepID=A0A4Z1KX38_9HELO|nr:uncharacterized protein EAF01_000370 [Botrytis porri]KAF7913964.1 hypothetical protein EAF01_000370 [Botrytis porri]TGO89147.1 hypothetical protein BPOR_0123g00180 [Botrytis porri]
MCNICQKIKAIQSIDSILLKPLKVILTKLHERIEPELGDSFLRREARIHSINKNLQHLQIGPLKPIIKLIISDLDSELRKLAVSKVDHPAYRTVGKYNDLTTKIGPDDSSSIRKWLENRAEEVRETKELKKMVALQGKSKIRRESGAQNDALAKPSYMTGPESTDSEYLSGTDDMTKIDYMELDDRLPVPGAVEWSTHVVDQWFKKNGENALLSEGVAQAKDAPRKQGKHRKHRKHRKHSKRE